MSVRIGTEIAAVAEATVTVKATVTTTGSQAATTKATETQAVQLNKSPQSVAKTTISIRRIGKRMLRRNAQGKIPN